MGFLILMAGLGIFTTMHKSAPHFQIGELTGTKCLQNPVLNKAKSSQEDQPVISL